MKFSFYLIFTLAAISSLVVAQEDDEQIAMKVWGKHSECRHEMQREYLAAFTATSTACLQENPSYTEYQCDDIADELLNEQAENDTGQNRCDDFLPTTFTPRGDAYGISYVGRVGGMMAANEGKLDVAVKIFEECIAAGSVECAFMLGQLKLYHDGALRDIEGAIKLFEYASEQGHSDAKKVLTSIPAANR